MKISENVIYGGRYIWWFDFENFQNSLESNMFFTSENSKKHFLWSEKSLISELALGGCDVSRVLWVLLTDDFFRTLELYI